MEMMNSRNPHKPQVDANINTVPVLPPELGPELFPEVDEDIVSEDGQHFLTADEALAFFTS